MLNTPDGGISRVSEIILEVGAEGGSLKLFRGNIGCDGWQFWIVTNETAVYDLLSLEDRGEMGEYFAKTGYVHSFQEALPLLDRYPWFGLYPVEVHPDYLHAVLVEVAKRGGAAAEARWRQLLNIVDEVAVRARHRDVSAKEPLLLDLKRLAKELIEEGWHQGGPETDADNVVLEVISQRDLDPADRKKALVDWLNRYKVLMGFTADIRTAIAGQITGFADERLHQSLHRDRAEIISAFLELKHRIATVTPRNITSLTSKALWCCYPDDVPIFDRNAASALMVLSRLCHLAAGPAEEEYARFIDVWFQVYWEVEPVISSADLSDCPHEIRVLDRLLWHLGQNGYWKVTAEIPVS